MCHFNADISFLRYNPVRDTFFPIRNRSLKRSTGGSEGHSFGEANKNKGRPGTKKRMAKKGKRGKTVSTLKRVDFGARQP